MAKNYTATAKTLHWISAILVFYQLASGVWMTRAIQDTYLRAIAWRTYQNHKSVGLTILMLTLFRLYWRLTHKPPEHKNTLQAWERVAAISVHRTMYTLLIISPLLGWLMVSTSPIQMPTLLYGLIKWPHVPYMPAVHKHTLYMGSLTAHKYAGMLLILLVTIHISAALKHHFYDKNTVLRRMLPTTEPKK